MTSSAAKKNERWARAAAIGSLWAAVEIILGSFLHAMRIPFAGTTLTFFSVALLTAFAMHYRQKGLFWRAALVAALLRSVMPTTVIFGPFIGILTEGLLFELSIRLLGFRFAAFALAGILAMAAALLHKIIALLILYGSDLVGLAQALYHNMLHTTGWNLPPDKLFGWLAVIYAVAGISAAALGWYLGRTAFGGGERISLNTVRQGGLKWNIPAGFKFKPMSILLHLAVLSLLLALLEWGAWYVAAALLAVYEIFLVYRYRHGMRRLAKPYFWFQLAVIGLLAVWLWNGSGHGLLTGTKMILRALLLVSAFTAIAIELRNPLVHKILQDKGWGGLYGAMESAMQVLPAVVDELGKEKIKWIRPVKLLQKILRISDQVAEEINEHRTVGATIKWITGPSGSGKTTRLQALYQQLKQQSPSLQVAGFITPAHYHQGQPVEYTLHCVHDGEKIPVASREAIFPDNIQVGRFFLNRKVFEECQEVLIPLLDRIDVLFIDEAGPLELNGGGWDRLIRMALTKEHLTVYITARDKLLGKLQQHYGLSPEKPSPA